MQKKETVNYEFIQFLSSMHTNIDGDHFPIHTKVHEVFLELNHKVSYIQYKF